MFMPVAIAQAAAVDDKRIVQQRPVRFLSCLELRKQPRGHFNVMLVDLLQTCDLGIIIEMMGQAMMRIGHADGTISAVTALAAHH